MARSLHEQLVAQIPPEIKKLVRKKTDIADRIAGLIDRTGNTHEQFAKEIGMKPSYLSRILSGELNLTLKTIARLEIALDEEIITMPKGAEYGLEPSASVWIAKESSIFEQLGYAALTIAGGTLTGPALVDLTGASSVGAEMEMIFGEEQEGVEREGHLPTFQYQHDSPPEMPLA